MNIISVILLNKRWSLIIVFLFTIMFLLLKVNLLERKVNDLEKNHTEYVNHMDNLLLQVKAEEAEKQLNQEKKYNENIKKIYHDADISHDRVNRLSKQLSQANSRIKTAGRIAVEEYARTQNNVLANCITEYRNMAKIADEHRADAQRLK